MPGIGRESTAGSIYTLQTVSKMPAQHRRQTADVDDAPALLTKSFKLSPISHAFHQAQAAARF